MLLPALLAAAVVTAWAFAKSALTDDRVALAAREDAGVEFGLILLAMVVLLFGAGIAIQLRAERRPLAEETRRRLGIAAIAVVASLPLIGLGALAVSERGIGGTVSDRWHDLTSADAATPQNEPGTADRDLERSLDLLEPCDRRLGEASRRRCRRRVRSRRPSFASGTSRRRASTLTDTCCKRSPTSASSVLR